MSDEPVREPAAGVSSVEGRAAVTAPSAPAAPAPGPPPAAAGRPDARPNDAPRPRPNLVESREPLHREAEGYRLRLDPADLTRLRELPGSKGKTDRELGEQFFDGQAARFAAALAGEVTPPAEIRVVVDPYSRQAFLALENRIRAILSF